MTNFNLINDAVKLVSQIEEAENIYETNNTIYNRCLDWYNHSEIIDAEMLAAVALNGPYDPNLKWNDLVAAKEYYFPTEPIEFSNFHIHEIEEALHDAIWW